MRQLAGARKRAPMPRRSKDSSAVENALPPGAVHRLLKGRRTRRLSECVHSFPADDQRCAATMMEYDRTVISDPKTA